MKAILHYLARTDLRAGTAAAIFPVLTGISLAFARENLSNLAVLVTCLVIALSMIGLAVWLQLLSRTVQAKTRIFRFGKGLEAIGAAVDDSHGLKTLSELERSAFTQFVEPIMRDLNLNAKLTYSGSAEAKQGHDRDMLLLGGPVRNKLAAEVNEALRVAANKGKYDGFLFENFDDPHGATRSGDPESSWCIKHSGSDSFVAPYCGLPKDKPDHDFGLLFVGPNPMAPARWLVWAAGIGPAGTYGALSVFGNEVNSALIGEALRYPRRYCCLLIKWAYKGESATQGTITAMMLSGGTMP